MPDQTGPAPGVAIRADQNLTTWTQTLTDGSTTTVLVAPNGDVTRKREFTDEQGGKVEQSFAPDRTVVTKTVNADNSESILTNFPDGQSQFETIRIGANNSLVHDTQFRDGTRTITTNVSNDKVTQETIETIPGGTTVAHVETTTLPDGTIMRSATGHDGSNTVEETSPSGRIQSRTKFPDGTTDTSITETLADGTTRNTRTGPDGQTTVTDDKFDPATKTQTTVATLPDGRVETTTTTSSEVNGVTVLETTAPDGSKLTTTNEPDGTTTETNTRPDGTLSTLRRDVDPDGTQTLEQRDFDGATHVETTSTAPDGSILTKVTDSDGTVHEHTLTLDGTTTKNTTKPDGTVEHVVMARDGSGTTRLEVPGSPPIVTTMDPDPFFEKETSPAPAPDDIPILATEPDATGAVAPEPAETSAPESEDILDPTFGMPSAPGDNAAVPDSIEHPAETTPAAVAPLDDAMGTTAIQMAAADPTVAGLEVAATLEMPQNTGIVPPVIETTTDPAFELMVDPVTDEPINTGIVPPIVDAPAVDVPAVDPPAVEAPVDVPTNTGIVPPAIDIPPIDSPTVEAPLDPAAAAAQIDATTGVEELAGFDDAMNSLFIEEPSADTASNDALSDNLDV